MDRRDFIKKASAGGLGLAMSRPLNALAGSRAKAQPNILFIMVDQLRFPSVFPKGVTSVDQFLAKFMPETYKLWKRGVKFGQHFGASSACGPSRGVMVTGLYSQQQWSCKTITSNANPVKISSPPVLDPVFPTYGKLLRQAGYKTPYIGKWHLSLLQAADNLLEPYGFDGMTKHDPTGANLQGTFGDRDNGFLSDHDVAQKAVQWLGDRTAGEQPWCLTVGLVNPHDHEFFWAGTEFRTFNKLFDSQSTFKPFNYYSEHNGEPFPPVVPWNKNFLKDPPSFGYPAVPPNWESAAQLEANKPAAHLFLKTFSECIWGGVSDDPNQDHFTIDAYPGADGLGIGVAPYRYWERNLDSYTQCMMVVDREIGDIVRALPADVADNTVIVFSSDHGDYVGAHGQVSNKCQTAYDEAFHVPLIVVDPSNRFTGDIDTVRGKLTSHVDLLNLLVSLGNNGSQNWLTGQYAQMYGNRHNMIPMLKSAAAPGRSYVLFATDDGVVPPTYDFNKAAKHVVGLRTRSLKFAAYSKWRTRTGEIIPSSIELEFYDYSTDGGRKELDSTPRDPRVLPLLKQMRNNLVPNELQAPLPGVYGVAQKRTRRSYLNFAHLVEHPPSGASKPDFVKRWLGFGNDF